MTTALFWKSLEISNNFYGFVLRYSLPLVWDHNKEMGIIQKKWSSLIYPYIYFVLMCAARSCSILVVFEVLVLNSVQIPIPVVLMSIVVVGISGLCLSITILIDLNLQVFCGQYLNTLFKYEEFMERRPKFCVTQLALLKTLKSGMYIISKNYQPQPDNKIFFIFRNCPYSTG